MITRVDIQDLIFTMRAKQTVKGEEKLGMRER